ncbi:MAG: phosphopyruvate hydratase [Candidatus Saliniplasma sp.]
MYEIIGVSAREIIDSRGNPTVETTVTTEISTGTAAVPSGASTGAREAFELRDAGERYGGKGVLKAVDNVNEVIASELLGMDVRDQSKIDKIMMDLDGTEDKSNLGANAILSVSLATARAGAKASELPLYRYLGRINDVLLPVPFMNVLNGGEHAGNDLDIQEYMIVPTGAENIHEAVMIGTEIYHELGKKIVSKYGNSARNVGDEGGYAPPLQDPFEPLDLLLDTLEETGYRDKVDLALDCAGSEFYKNGAYQFAGETLKSEDMIEFYERLIEEYPVISIEDPLAEDDWAAFIELTDRIGDSVQIVGDDLFVTNPELITEGIDRDACNCLLLKVNQIGSLTEAMDSALIALRNGYDVQISHRSGETCDDFIADLSVALSAGQIKAGAPARSERTAKYNRLMEIEEQVGETSRYGSIV